ncbi:hypothetical protein F4780DRAFT_775556 [Xylariomycetidae sp. FL0641]|nr:hypothetical protein F4780DRAFT_775556 [Xylariomycetidae sp. FL0641]
MPSKSLYLFGDQASEVLPSIRELTKLSARSPSLSHFFTRSTDRLRNVLSRSNRHLAFANPLELAELAEKDQLHDTAVAAALLTASQIGSLILHLESEPRALELSAEQPVLLGICTGLLAAAAASCCRNLTELLWLADEVVELAFRIGAEAARRASYVEASTASWAVLASGVDAGDAEEAIERFNARCVLAPNKKAYVSARGASSITVSGPPSTISRLMAQSETFARARKIPLPIWAGFHAEHMDPIPLDRITEGFSSATLDAPVQRPVVSPSSGQPYEGTTFSQLLLDIVNDILQLPIHLEATAEGLSRLLQPQATLVRMGPASSAKSIMGSLASHGVHMTEAPEQDANRHNGATDENAIAIVGMAARLPGSETLEEFWQVLEAGRDLHEPIRPDRFDVATHCDGTGKRKNASLTPYGVFVDRPGYFDTRLFNMSPREAAQTDPQQRLLLLTTYEALEMAGYQPGATPATAARRIGSYVGQTSDDYREVNASQDVDTFFITGGIRAFGPGRLNYHFGWEGPSYSVDTACSSSAASIQLACSALLARECDTAIGGGANLLTSSDLFAGLSRGNFLSKTGGCKTFDHDADGYVRADAVGVVVLKRLADAVADRDNILAVVKGATTNHSAEAVSITHPHAGTQERLFQSVLDKSGLRPQDIDYVELHGTGTQAGDATESRSVTNVLSRNRSSPLYIGTVKPNLGHGEAASGVTSLMKAIMMFRKNIIPPHVGIKGRMNQKLPPLSELNTHISFGKTPFLARANGDGKRRILINNFDAAGGNTSMVIEEAPAVQLRGTDPRGHHVVAVSGKTPNAFVNNSRRLLEHIIQNPEIRLQDLAYTTTSRRMHSVLRQAHAVSSLGELSKALTTSLASEVIPKPSTVPPTPVFLFTGQGSLYANIAKELFETHPGFRDSILAYERICVSFGFESFVPLITSEDLDLAAASPQQVQLAIVSVELAITELWKSLGVQPSAVIGHSLGEYPALCTAGVISLSDCIYLVGKRAEIMSSECTPGTHSMLAIKESADRVESLLREHDARGCDIACANSPQSTVVSAEVDQIKRLQEKLASSGVKTTALEVQFAFHSAQMECVLDKYGEIAEKVHFNAPIIPLASTLLGELVTEKGTINAEYLRRQTREKVQYSRALTALKSSLASQGRLLWVETGPNPVCLGLVNATFGAGEVLLPSLKRGDSDWKVFSSSVAKAYSSGVGVCWPEFHRPYEQSLRLLELPRYAFDLKNYWIQYRGDWAMRKGDAPAVHDVAEAPKSAFYTTTLHRIESESIGAHGIKVVFATDASEPKLNTALRGHLVNGAGLCPSSVYADMAFTAAKYLQSVTSPSSDLSMDVRAMEVHKPLLIQPGDTKQVIRITASQTPSSSVIDVKFSSQDGDVRQEHAHCNVLLGDGAEWQSGWSRNAYLIRARMDHLVASSAVGQAHKLLRPMVYKLFASFVDYIPKYQGMEEVYMDSGLLEAMANVKFASDQSDGNFTYSPYWIDSIAHLSGFVLNGADTTPADSVFISHGWGSMKIVGQLSASKRYQSYVRMQETQAPGVLSGDVYLFEGAQVVAVCEDLKFQRIKRTILDHLLPPVRPSGLPAPKPATKTVVKRTVITESQPRVIRKETEIVVSKPTMSSFDAILSVIASEVGVEMVELSEDALFADLGVDSLLSISIVAKLGEILGREIPATLFNDYLSVQELQTYFSASLSGTSTPSTETSTVESTSDYRSSASTEMSTPAATPYPAGGHAADNLQKIIAQELGLELHEIDEETPLTEYGVDSLLSLAILASVNASTDLELPSSFLMDYPTLAAIKEALGAAARPTRDMVLAGAAQPPATTTPLLKAEAVLLQSASNKQAPTLFLLPDGSGSAGSYIGLPKLNSPGGVYGLNSPFLAAPASFKVPLQVAAAMYVVEMRRVQPRGPYRLGGWSIGGSYAFEAARQLIQDHGEAVDLLVLIDAPCPKTLPPLPLETIKLLEDLKAFDGMDSGSSRIRESVRQHFEGSVNALRQYHPSSIPNDRAPKTVSILWAEKGVWESVEDAASRKQSTQASQDATSDWIMDPRRTFGPNGWDSLLPGAHMTCETVEGNHFSLMRKPAIAELGRKISHVLEGL